MEARSLPMARLLPSQRRACRRVVAGRCQKPHYRGIGLHALPVSGSKAGINKAGINYVPVIPSAKEPKFRQASFCRPGLPSNRVADLHFFPVSIVFRRIAELHCPAIGRGSVRRKLHCPRPHPSADFSLAMAIVTVCER
jgi:hypothetical protein